MTKPRCPKCGNERKEGYKSSHWWWECLHCNEYGEVPYYPED